MNTTTSKVLIFATGAAICLGGSLVTAPAQAKTDVSSGGTTAVATPDTSVTGMEIDELVLVRKLQLARTYATDAVAQVSADTSEPVYDQEAVWRYAYPRTLDACPDLPSPKYVAIPWVTRSAGDCPTVDVWWRYLARRPVASV